MHNLSSNVILIRFYLLEAIYHNHLIFCFIYFIYQSISYLEETLSISTKKSQDPISVPKAKW